MHDPSRYRRLNTMPDRELLTADDLALRPGRGVRSPWLRDALEAEGNPAPLPGPAGDVDCDVAIVGGGYTGMWTAYQLKRRAPELRLVLIEQDICGGGPSGRNGGFVNAWWDELDALVDLHGPEAGARLRPGRLGVGGRDRRVVCRARRGRPLSTRRDAGRLHGAGP